MADKTSDAVDRLLASAFAAEPIADDGFSDSIVTKLRRRIWVRRLALPVAMLIGGAIAIKPASQLLLAASKLLTVVPQEVVNAPTSWLPQVQDAAISGSLVQTMILGAMLLVAGLVGGRILAE